MAGSFSANPDAIKSAGANFAQAGDQARIIDQNLQDKVAGNQPIAGNDEYGNAFWSAVGPSITASSQVLRGLGDGFDTVNENLDFTANAYTKANEISTDLAAKMYTG